MIVKLTSQEREALAHRLSCDGLNEVTIAEGFDPQVVEDAIDAAGVMVARGEIDDAAFDPCLVSVLRDCVEGSTWVGVVDADENPALARAAKRTLRGLARKLESLGLSEIHVPWY
jgi:hypothetical protein